MDAASAVGAAGAAMVDEQKPSLFELLSEQQLHGLLPPTLRYLLTVATQRHPRYLLRALNAFDELYALAMLVVERHFLRTTGGTFTEHFYGLKRERMLAGTASGGGSGVEVPRAAAGAPEAVGALLRLGGGADLWRNLAVVVGVPYVQRKLADAYEADAPRARLGAAYQRLPARPTLRERARHAARWFLRHVYPSAHAAYGFAVLACQLAYLFDGARAAHPLLWLVGTRVRRMTGADYRALDEAASRQEKAAGRLLGGLSLVLPASIFALKFLEWWHASDFAKQLSLRAAAHLDLPPPLVGGAAAAAPSGSASTARKGILKKDTRPPADERAPVSKTSLLPILTVAAPADSALCPICGERVTGPTACQTGVVYCYVCIHKWVAGTHDRQEALLADAGRAGRWESGAGRCAVTGRRVLGGTAGLRRLMV